MAAPTILLRDDRRIVLSNGQFGRPVTLPASWASVRFGIRVEMTYGGALSNNIFRFGIGSGTTNMIGDATCTNFIGAMTSNIAWIDGGDYYNTGGGAGSGWFGFTKVGSTETPYWTYTIGPNYPYLWHTASTSPYRSLWLVSITKGSPNYTVDMMARSASSSDVSSTQFLNAMLSGSLTGHTWGTHSAVLACSEVAGTFNSVQMMWNRTDCQIEISDIAVAVF